MLLKRRLQCGSGLVLLGDGLILALSLLQEGVVVLAFWNIFRRIARKCDGVENEAELATLGTGRHSVQADVELGAISGVGVLGVRVGGVKGVLLVGLLGALEA